VRPGYAEALNNRGKTLQKLKRFDEALASYEKAIALKPELKRALSGLAVCALEICDWTWRHERSAEVCRHISEQKSIIPPLLLLSYSEDPSLQLQCAKNYIRELSQPRAGANCSSPTTSMAWCNLAQ
jgi:protein O-GlcNAc transferase